MKFSIYASVLIFLIGINVSAQSSIKGEVSLETRLFKDDDNNKTEDSAASLFSRLVYEYEFKHSKIRFRGFARGDGVDDSRDIIAIEEFIYSYFLEDWELKAGSQILSWTATEAFHPADVLNSRNLDGNFEGAEKIGEPMLAATKLTESGKISFFYMPLFMRPKLSESTNRFSFVPAGVDLKSPLHVGRRGDVVAGDSENQWAVRWDNSFESFDLGLHYIDHVDRSQPIIVSEGGKVRPIYLPVKQSGLTIQAPLGSWVFKFEGAYRDFRNNSYSSKYGLLNQLDHGQVAMGFDYGFSHKQGGESTFIIEHQRYLGVDKAERANLGLFQNDILFGYRYAFNDALSKEFFVFIIHDLERTNETMLNIKYSQRLTDIWSIETGALFVDAPLDNSGPVGLQALNQDNQIYLNLSRFF